MPPFCGRAYRHGQHHRKYAQYRCNLSLHVSPPFAIDFAEHSSPPKPIASCGKPRRLRFFTVSPLLYVSSSRLRSVLTSSADTSRSPSSPCRSVSSESSPVRPSPRTQYRAKAVHEGRDRADQSPAYLRHTAPAPSASPNRAIPPEKPPA